MSAENEGSYNKDLSSNWGNESEENTQRYIKIKRPKSLYIY